MPFLVQGGITPDDSVGLETIPRRIRENLIALGTEDQVVIDEDAAIAVEREKL